MTPAQAKEKIKEMVAKCFGSSIEVYFDKHENGVTRGYLMAKTPGDEYVVQISVFWGGTKE